jgi:CheY-like chemotaxis protein
MRPDYDMVAFRIAKEEHFDEFQKALKKNRETTEKAHAQLDELRLCIGEIQAHRQAIEQSPNRSMATSQNPDVLVVEDLDDDFFFFCRALSKANVTFAYIRAKNGVEARTYLETNGHRPHLIFLDLKLPLVNGFELLEWLRTQQFHGQIQIVILSASENSNDMEKARSFGVAGYLVKPISTEILSQSIQSWRGKLREIRPAL